MEIYAVIYKPTVPFSTLLTNIHLCIHFVRTFVLHAYIRTILIHVIKTVPMLCVGRDCVAADYKDWSPADSPSVDCLLGRTTVYQRRQPSIVCFNGADFNRGKSVKNCPCSIEDYEWWVIPLSLLLSVTVSLCLCNTLSVSLSVYLSVFGKFNMTCPCSIED